MKIAVVRTAFSPIIYDAYDFACAFYDRNIQLLAQSQTVPLFQGSLNLVIENALKAIGGAENLKEGDVIVSNYGYETGTHANDIAVILPGFVGGEHVAYAVLKAHMMDVGGKSMVPVDSTDVWQEGLILPGVKLYEGGVLNEALYKTILMNSRLPKDLEGDLNALIGAGRLGLNALYPLIERYDLDEFDRSVNAMYDYGERVVRDRIAALKMGRWEVEGQMDDDGVLPESIPYKLAVEVRDDSIHVDLTDIPPQRMGPVNVPFGSTLSGIRAAIMAFAGHGEAANEGHFRPISIETKKGTIFDPISPAPIGLYGFMVPQLMDMIFRALANAKPDGVAASGPELGALVVLGLNDKGEIWGGACDLTGGQPASLAYGDGGAPLMHIEASGTRTTSWEVWEARYPMVVEKSEYAIDSGGAGKFRGGNGFDIRLRALEPMTLIPIFERTKLPMSGLFGGEEGRSNTCRITRPDGETTYHSHSELNVPAGTVIEINMCGGGGVGAPGERDADKVREDVREGYVSEAAARRSYPHAF
ncbi:MAG: hydantoinase B/oxoprolinase family protein [Caulobacterales bacterium]|nr:hydantoinase B/oxoprolinase family protein [Caulobacterales bacterium]